MAVAIGLGLGQLPAVAEPADLFILPFLVLMLFGVFLGFLGVPLASSSPSCSLLAPRTAFRRLPVAKKGELWFRKRLLPTVLAFFGFNLVLVFALRRIFRIEYGDFVSLCCTTLARNSPLALAITEAAFPDQPLIALALVIGPLIELPILGASLEWSNVPNVLLLSGATGIRTPDL